MALSSVLVSTGTVIAIYGLLALGLNIKFGYNGLLDIGHVAFYLVGAYMTALLVLPPPSEGGFATYVLGWNWPWLPAIAAGTLVAGVLGMLVALPAIRLREDYLAIAVLGISVIVKRTFQTETWLANGPTSLKGWSDPLGTYFPLPGRSPQPFVLFDVPGSTMAPEIPAFDWVLFGIVVGTFWGVGTYLLGRVLEPAAEPPANPHAMRRWLRRGLFAVTTGGAGYVAVWLSRRAGRGLVLPALGVGVLAGVLAAAGAALGAGPTSVLVFLGLFSLYTWVLAGVAIARHYDTMTLGDAAIGLGLTIGFVLALLPLVVLGAAAGDMSSRIGLLLSLGLLIAFLYGVYYLSKNWAQYDRPSPFVSVVGIAAIWLFVLRYFVFSAVSTYQSTGLNAALAQPIQNLLWLALFRFGAADPIVFGYSRFFFAVSVATLAGAYALTQVTVESPFGRVLKAIREDETVAKALGKDTFSYKVQSMILGSALAGLAGGLTTIYLGTLVHTMFAPRVTFIVLLMVIIGGTANNRGVILGSVIYWAFQKGSAYLAGFFPPEARSSVAALRLAFIGALLIVILYYRPEGIWGEERMTTAGAEE